MSKVSTSHDYGMHNKNFSVYFSGFLMCVILTLIPFYAVIHKVSNKHNLIMIVLSTAVIQFFVQVICFLRLKYNSNQGAINVLSFIFTGIVTFVIIGGSIWIMTSLDYFMVN